MHATINQPVKVNMVVDQRHHAFTIHNILWQDNIYSVISMVYLRSIQTLKDRVHIFKANVGPFDMELHLNEETLEVTLTEVSDGLAQ